VKYQFEPKLSIHDSVKKISLGFVKDAISECKSKELTHEKKIHILRKRCKRIRGLLRIVRPHIGEAYGSENEFYRDLARKLSVTRDQHAAIETLNKLANIQRNISNTDLFKKIIQQIEIKLNKLNSSALIDEFEIEISEGSPRINSWDININGFRAIEDGFKKTYKQGKKAMINAFNNPTAENYHEWRKRVKYHYFHLDLLAPIWIPIMRNFSKEADHLSEMLGYDHDLCVLKKLLNDNNQFKIEELTRKKLFEAINKEQSKLREKIKFLGQKVYTEKPKHLIERLESYWYNWKEEKTSLM